MALNLNSLLTKILDKAAFRNPNLTLTQPISLSYKNTAGTPYRAIGAYYPSTSSAISMDTFISNIRYSSGACGYVRISAYSTVGQSMTGGYYWYCYIPHRNGGTNGAAQSDNCNYGTLILINDSYYYSHIIQFNNGSIAENIRINTTAYRTGSSTDWFTATSNSSYSLNTANCSMQGYAGDGYSSFVTVTVYVDCTSPSSSWVKIGELKSVTGGNTAASSTYFSLTNSAGTTIQCYISGRSIYARGGYAGHGFQGTMSYLP